ncbi:MAG TPA: hypothetical protein VKD88_00770 [Gaiellaceae bacterium]|nr:hypothetical protein [Gaiellaceae bacterium]
MTEPNPESPFPPETAYQPIEPDAELSRRNVIFGLALFGFVLMLYGATILVAYVYLSLD